MLAWLGFSYMSIIYARLASAVTLDGDCGCTSPGGGRRCGSRVPALREILPSGTGFFVKRLLDYSAQNGDNLVVGKRPGAGARSGSTTRPTAP